MKALLLQGGARKKGNTAKVLAWVEQELTSLGHEVEIVYLHSKILKDAWDAVSASRTLMPWAVSRKTTSLTFWKK